MFWDKGSGRSVETDFDLFSHYLILPKRQLGKKNPQSANTTEQFAAH